MLGVLKHLRYSSLNPSLAEGLMDSRALINEAILSAEMTERSIEAAMLRHQQQMQQLRQESAAADATREKTQ